MAKDPKPELKTSVAVIGAGHAGVEAALASARMGVDTVLFTLSLDGIANMPCNPSIGGTAKGHLVFEIDALGGEMGYAADRVTLQSRTLNLGKGAAVQSKRIQADRQKYHRLMKQTLENTPHLRVVQAEIVEIGTTREPLRTDPQNELAKRVRERAQRIAADDPTASSMPFPAPERGDAARSDGANGITRDGDRDDQNRPNDGKDATRKPREGSDTAAERANFAQDAAKADFGDNCPAIDQNARETAQNASITDSAREDERESALETLGNPRFDRNRGAKTSAEQTTNAEFRTEVGLTNEETPAENDPESQPRNAFSSAAEETSKKNPACAENLSRLCTPCGAGNEAQTNEPPFAGGDPINAPYSASRNNAAGSCAESGANSGDPAPASAPVPASLSASVPLRDCETFNNQENKEDEAAEKEEKGWKSEEKATGVAESGTNLAGKSEVAARKDPESPAERSAEADDLKRASNEPATEGSSRRTAAFHSSESATFSAPATFHVKQSCDDADAFHVKQDTSFENEAFHVKQAGPNESSGEDGSLLRVCSVTTRLGEVWACDAVVVATGTYLSGAVFVGNVSYEAGPDGSLPAKGLSEALRSLGVRLVRFKTGTPARVQRRSINFSALEEQPGENEIVPYSVRTPEHALDNVPQIPCHIVYTNSETHRIIRENITRSAMYSGKIHGTGPRYCPSIEDKLVRFADKDRHQLFVEPLGEDTSEMYLQGFSTSLPTDVQHAMIHTLPGFEKAEIMRYAYAIEYDCADPTQMDASLQFKSVKGLFGAGQFNGTSGYEEAAAQGLVAGVNAAHLVCGLPPMILSRTESYIGTLLDDLVTKGTNEPYRMMTSRSEYRLLLRQDNADSRLTAIGYAAGLVSDSQFEAFEAKKARIRTEKARLERTFVSPETANPFLLSLGETPLKSGASLADLLRRPLVTYGALASIDAERPQLSRAERMTVENDVKYEGYAARQLAEVRRQRHLEEKLLPESIRYDRIKGLRIEAAQKLEKIRPRTVGQASRISGVNPADISVLLIYLGLH